MRAGRATGCRVSGVYALKVKTGRRVPVIWFASRRISEMKYVIWASIPARLLPMPG